MPGVTIFGVWERDGVRHLRPHALRVRVLRSCHNCPMSGHSEAQRSRNIRDHLSRNAATLDHELSPAPARRLRGRLTQGRYQNVPEESCRQYCNSSPKITWPEADHRTIRSVLNVKCAFSDGGPHGCKSEVCSTPASATVQTQRLAMSKPPNHTKSLSSSYHWCLDSRALCLALWQT